jgi:hypothetical protein
MTVIGTNTAALRAGNASNAANKLLSTAMERLSTGKRINSAKDDAAGLAIASTMTASIRGMNQAHPQRERRHLAGADRRRRAGRSHQHAAAYPRAGRPVGFGHL